MENGSASDSSGESFTAPPPEESAPGRAEVDISAPSQSVKEETVDHCLASDSSGAPPMEIPRALFTAPPPEESALRRAEVDTSAPFQSVKEAVDRFGGCAVWNLQLKQLFHPEEHHSSEDVDFISVEEQATLLEKDLIMKERKTLDVLKELEMTKKVVDGLKMKLQKETIEASKMSTISSDSTILAQEMHDQSEVEKFIDVDSSSVGPKQSAGLILQELKHAKENLNRATDNLADIRESIELLNSKIEEEKHLLEATQEKLVSNAATLTSLEKEYNQTTEKLQETQYLESKRSGDPSHISQEIKEINAEMEQSRKVTEAAKLEVDRLTAEIDQTKTSIKTAEIRMLAAKKMEEAARAAEAVALAEIKALMSSNNSTSDASVSSITLSTEEYITLMRKAQEADEASKRKIEVAMEEVNEANRYRSELLFKVEEANAEAKAYKSALEDALKRVEDANRGKLAVEEALRTWRSEQGQRRHNFRNTTKFKSYSAHHRWDSRVLDLNGSSLITDPPSIGLHPPLSIGQILSMKLMVPGGNEWEKENEKPNVSLGQMLNKKPGHGDMAPQQIKDDSANKATAATKRKKLGFVGLSLVLAKQNKKNKKKRQSLDTSPAASFGKARREDELRC